MTSVVSPNHGPFAAYPSPVAMRADLAVHIIGLIFALFGGGIMLGLVVGTGSPWEAGAIAVYVGAFITMLAMSTAYNFAAAAWRPLLSRFDHAGIFLMIAGSYTPFTTQALHGAWAIGMTVAAWVLAGIGILGKLFLPGLSHRIWVVFYLALGWLVLIAIRPIAQGVSVPALVLLTVGGLVYSIGTLFYMSDRLKLRLAIWHSHVVLASILHYVAILVGVVLVEAG